MSRKRLIHLNQSSSSKKSTANFKAKSSVVKKMKIAIKVAEFFLKVLSVVEKIEKIF